MSNHQSSMANEIGLGKNMIDLIYLTTTYKNTFEKFLKQKN